MARHRHGGARILRRRWLVLGGVGLALLGGAAAHAAGGIELTPSSGPPGTPYKVTVSCGEAPLVYQGFSQGDHVPGTIGPRPSDEVNEVSPSTWQVDATAGGWDSPWYATCGDSEAGSARFDTDNPQLWFGPRPSCCGEDPSHPRTILEGTDCPAGSTATVSFTVDGTDTGATAAVDELGDWSVPLPGPLGSQELTIDASCGAVVYDQVTVTTTSTSTPGTVPATVPASVPATVPPATPATPQDATADFTG